MKKFVCIVMALAMVFCMVASADQLSDIKEKGVLVVGSSVGFPPYEFYYTNPETGEEEYAGFEMSLAKGVAEMLGVELVIADQAFSGLITALRGGEIDMIISGMAIRDDRKEVVDFTDPYYSGTQILLVRAEDSMTYQTTEDLKGKIVAAQMGSLQAGILDDQFAECEGLTLDNVQLLVMSLVQGQVDGVLLTDNVAYTYMAKYAGQLAISAVPVIYEAGTGCGIGVNKGDNESLLAVLNEYIAQIKADGTFDAWVAEAGVKNATLLDDAE